MESEWNLGKVLKWGVGVPAIIIAILAILFGPFAKIWLDYYFFESLGYQSVFLKNLATKAGIFFVVFFGCLGIFSLIWKVTKKELYPEGIPEEGEERFFYNLGRAFFTIVTLAFSGGLAWWAEKTMWFNWLCWFNRESFGIADPVFNKDISFYFFGLPIIRTVLWAGFFTGLVVCVILFIIGILAEETSWIEDAVGEFFGGNKRYFRVALGMTIIFGSLLCWFHRYLLLYSTRGVVNGAGYTDLHVWLLFWTILAVILFLGGIWTIVGRAPHWKKLVTLIGIVALIGIIFLIAGGIVQNWSVEPNELNKEGKYLEREIAFTREGFDLNRVIEKNYPGNASLNLSILHSPTVKNIRIIDYKAVKDTLIETQTLRLYYDYKDLDIDRYTIKGNVTQVIVAPRELEQEKLPKPAKTWINKRMIYTHGFGFSMCPVNEIDSKGQPVLFVKDIPPVSNVNINVSQPRIYYGEATRGWIITNTKEKEFDYVRKKGEELETVYLEEYPGKGGIKLNTGWKRLIAAMRLDFFKILLSDSIVSESRLHIYREVRERVSEIAPFIYWDDDAQFVGENGSYFIIQGVVKSDKMPYSSYGRLGGKRINYARDSVKAVVDCLSGSVTFYYYNENPLINTYRKIYPGLFKPLSEMPEFLRNHLKYSEDLFNLQVEKYTVYHMIEVKDFYSKEDKWEFSSEKYRGETKRTESYNILVELEIEGEKKLEFVLMTTLTPKNKNNLISWMAVCQNPENYGKIICFRFPRGQLIYGPMQVEARIDQDPEISKLMTLWGQKGSEVLRGNLLVIPVEGSILYVEPIYLSAEGVPIPELKRVVVVYGDTIGIGENLEEALIKALSGAPEIPEIPEVPEKPELKAIIEQIRALLDQLNQLLDKLEQLEE